MRSRYIYDKEGHLIYAEENGEVKLNNMAETNRPDFYVMPDVQPFRSMIDGSLITSRGKYRQHLRQHNCVEVGNDSSIREIKPKPIESPPGLKQAIIDAVNKVEARQRR